MKSAQGAGTRERDPSASINGSSGPVLSPIPPAPLVEPAKRRRPIGFLAAAVVLVIAGGMGAVWAVNQSGERSEVVGVARQVEWGEVITAQDLAVVEVIPDVNLRPVPWADRSALIGKRVATTLVPGSLVTDESVTSAAVVGEGQAVVGVTVKQEQAPMQTLNAQDQVHLVIAPPSGADQDKPPVVVTGAVLSATSANSSGARTVDVLVAQADSDALALAASSGRVTIVLVPRS